jgi:hypothetical protein
LAGCAHNSGSPAAAPDKVALSAKVTPACERLAKSVPHPKIAAGEPTRAVIARYVAALEQANARIGAQGKCVAELSAAYTSYAVAQ